VVWLLGALVYLALHALLYATVLRSRDTFRRERGIFAYHALSAFFVSLTVLVGLALTSSSDVLVTIVAVVCLHGIFSTSFLELWSLSQGSYSLKILRHVATADAGDPVNMAVMEDAGIAHRTHRLEALTTLRIARRRGDALELAPLGQVAAGVLALIAWLANVRQTTADSPEVPAP
jgi:hypothetical protein